MLISAQAWKKLSPEQQEILRQAAIETRDWERQLCRDLEGKFLQQIKDAGTTQINDDVNKDAFAQATRPVWDIYAKRFGDGTIKAIQNVQ